MFYWSVIFEKNIVAWIVFVAFTPSEQVTSIVILGIGKMIPNPIPLGAQRTVKFPPTARDVDKPENCFGLTMKPPVMDTVQETFVAALSPPLMTVTFSTLFHQ